MQQIVLEPLNKDEALRYLGYKENTQMVSGRIDELIDHCSNEVIKSARPMYIYRVFDIDFNDEGVSLINTGITLRGNSIKEHLKDCQKAVVFAATISMDIDRLIRKTQMIDMAEAMITDSFASVAVEQTCDKVEEIIKEKYSEYYQTFRFGIGYGDLPIEQQPDVLRILDASKKIGLTVTPSNMLNPTKSVTAIIGLSENEIKKGNRGCTTCSFRDKCQLSKNGGHCNG